MVKEPKEFYLELMQVVRNRLDVIEMLANSGVDDYGKAEMAAFHGRKIIEAIAFGCLIAIKNGLKHIPKDAQGQYNAETIFKMLNKKRIEVFPSPSLIRYATQEEIKDHNVKGVIYGVPERRITKEELIKKYQRMHNWLHELNPYTKDGQEIFHQKNALQLWKDLDEVSLFLQSHVMSIKGEAFFCILKDKIDGLTKVSSLSKISSI